MISHNWINSIGVIVAIAFTSFTFYEQIKSEGIEVTTSERNLTDLVSVGKGSFRSNSGKLLPVMGPISWGFSIYNPSEQDVSITNFSTHLLSENNSLTFYTSMNASITGQGNVNSEIELPLKIAPREVKELKLNLFVPVSATDQQMLECLGSPLKLEEVERCFLVKGSDLFGNPITVTIDKDFDKTSIGYNGPPDGPVFMLEITTGDRTKTTVNFEYF